MLWAIVLLAPFALLLSTEFALRAAGFGHDLEPLFIAAPQQDGYLQANPAVVARFFVDPDQAPRVSIETAYFAAPKPAGALRVFVQGESSAAGFPYGLGASLAGVLDQRLERTFPDREVEVISTALSAINSYALADFADEIVAQQPDAVVIYVGHNEYLGILGVGSSFRMAATPAVTRAYLALRELRLFQGVARLLGVGRPHDTRAPGTATDSLMARVAGDRVIPLNSAQFRRGEVQFRANLDLLLAKYHRAGVPVFIGTLVSNERDQEPLAVLAAGETDAAGAAKTAYHAARDADAAEQYEAAREGYSWARDLDPLRFRAPAVFSAIVAAAAARHGAHLVDVRARFAAASPHGLVGNMLLLEHVHPNLDGYFLLADAFYDALLASGVAGPPLARVSDEQARAEMPVSEVDRWLGEYKTHRVKSSWPFATTAAAPPAPTSPTSLGAQLALQLFEGRTSWPEAQERLRRHYLESGNHAEYTRLSTILADAFPFAPAYQFQAAAALIEAGRAADARRYSRRAMDLEPGNVNHLLVGAHALLLTGRRDEGRALLERVLRLQPENPTARRVLDELSSR